LERKKLEDEQAELLAKIAYYKGILSDEKALLGVIREEISETKKKFGDSRRTKIGIDDGELEDEDLIPDENEVITLTRLGYIKRMSIDTFRAQNRGGRGIKGIQTLSDDVTEQMIITNTHNSLLFFTNTGRVFRMKVYQIPEASRTARGTAIINLLQLQPGETVATAMAIETFEGAKNLVMATKKGMIKKTEIAAYANIRTTGIIGISLREGDELIEVKPSDGNRDILMISKKGKAIRFAESEVRPTGRDSMGVTGMRLSNTSRQEAEAEDEVIAMIMDIQGEYILFATENGMGKRTKIEEFSNQHRGGMGVICYKITSKTGDLIEAKAVKDGDQIMLITSEGIIIRTSTEDVSIIGRNTSGVKLINVDGDDVKVTGMARLAKEDIPEEEDFEEETETLEEEDSEKVEDFSEEENLEEDKESAEEKQQ
jgi:DNA gyrase subunit A